VHVAGGAAVTDTFPYQDTDTDSAGPDPASSAALTSVSDGTTTDTFDYDAAGRVTQRTADGVATTLTWDASSNLTSTTTDGVTTVYAYHASGQRVAQATLASDTTAGTATPYVASSELTNLTPTPPPLPM
jgi:YD repeat-containing protein